MRDVIRDVAESDVRRFAERFGLDVDEADVAELAERVNGRLDDGLDEVYEAPVASPPPVEDLHLAVADDVDGTGRRSPTGRRPVRGGDAVRRRQADR